MGAVSLAVGSVLNVPEDSARFLLALYGVYLFSIIYRYYMSRRSAAIQNGYWALSGTLIITYIYGLGVWHVLVDIVAVYCTLWLFGGTMVSVAITWIITMGHLMAGYLHVMYSNEIHPIAWTIPHCVLVLKLIGLAFNVYDGKKKQDKLSDEMKASALHKVPSFFEIMGFCLFPGTALAGPQMSFVRYRDFVEGKLFNYHSTPSSTFAGVQRLMIGTGMSVLYAFLNTYYPIDFLATQGFADEPYVRKLWLVFVTGKVVLWRYIAVWLFAEGSCIITGISYNGLDKSGRPDWSGLTNIKLYDFETCITLQGVIDSFNVNTNDWMKMYVFKRLKWMGNRELSFGLTLVYVSLWHGFWPGYYINFMLEFLLIFASQSFISTARSILGGPLSQAHPVLKVPLSLVAYCMKNLLLLYPVTCFMLLSWGRCYAFMKAVYFYAHVVVFVWLVGYQLFLWLQRRWRRQKQD